MKREGRNQKLEVWNKGLVQGRRELRCSLLNDSLDVLRNRRNVAAGTNNRQSK
jgi:hypothetical protein